MNKKRILFLLEWMLRALTFMARRDKKLEKDIEILIKDVLEEK